MNDTVKEIEQAFPQGKPVMLKGKPHNIMPFGFGQYPKVLKLLKEFNPESIPATAVEAKGFDGAALGKLIAENAEAVINLCVLATKQKPEFFDDLPGDEGVVLCQAIIEVNADFFVHRLSPKLLEALSGIAASVGALSSQGSSAPATV